eukprot:CAMPEP_0204017782 /NCGR_PEP_ID=MMETSP0360-20130528/27635_1 /ASSEMBLY_ACC=CAM_ASM_000342 /TAXON_ID=268821 /ORGANISM="Scrippsiella Hangoei, Strain SHTV-5" /LENGTH=73 /DNA_ID=CAMNT_0050960859 /DNA_START=44 /DNA_END=262 /DNA_ORIENTATION=-
MSTDLHLTQEPGPESPGMPNTACFPHEHRRTLAREIMSSVLQSLQQIRSACGRPKFASFPQGQRRTAKLIMPS